MPKVSYSPATNIMSVKLKSSKSVDSDVSGNVVVDYDKNGEIVNIDIMKINLDEFQKQHMPVEQFLTIKRSSKWQA